MEDNAQTASDFLRPSEAASYLKISRRTLYVRDASDPDFPRKIVQSPRCVGYSRKDLDAYLSKKKVA